MFTIWCPQHESITLIWPSNVDAVVNTADGIEVHVHCTCGHREVILTGRAFEGGGPAVAS
jgi:hypothetical protein